MATGLRYMPDADQLALANELDGAIAAALPITRFRADQSHDEEASWQRLDELGILNAGMDEAAGGSGLGAVEQALIALSLGRALAAPAVTATMVAGGLDAIPSGSGRIATGFAGASPCWLDEARADHLLLRDCNGATIHALPGESRLLDDVTWAVRMMGGEVGPATASLPPDRLLLLRLLDAAMLAGNAAATLAMAVDYASTREQFGRPIGGFQAVKHHCANMAIAARSAHDLVVAAAVALDDGRGEARHQVESAVLIAADAAIGNAGLNIQVHGGIGFSAEADPHLFLKRAQLMAALNGGIDAAASRVAETICG